MKQLITLCLILACAGFSLGAVEAATSTAASKTYKGDVQSIRIPKGTQLNLQLIDPISTKVGYAGDEFSAMLKKDQIVNSMVALPAGSIFRGTITKVVPSKRLSRSAIIYINLDHVVSPTGRQIPVSAGLIGYSDMTLDGGLYSGGNYGWAVQQNWKKTKEITSNAINWGKSTGDNMQYVTTSIGAIGGAIGGGAYFVGDSVADLFRRGNDVNLAQDQEMTVLLTQPIDLPKH